MENPPSDLSNMGAECILLSKSHLDDTLEIARSRYERWKKNTAAHYENHPLTHFRGALGEVAVEEWMHQKGIKAISKFREEKEASFPDFIIPLIPECIEVGIDVKTWAGIHWTKLGRCISPNQYEFLRQKRTDIILWAMTDDVFFWGKASEVSWEKIEENIQKVLASERGGLDVTLWGWSWLLEVPDWPLVATGYNEKRENYQAPLERLHDMTLLERFLNQWPGMRSR